MPREYVFRSVTDWNKDQFPKIEGTIKEFGKLPKELDSRPFLVIDAEQGLFRVYKAWELEEVFKVGKVGMGIEIVFVGTKSIKGNKTVNRYNVRLWK